MVTASLVPLDGQGNGGFAEENEVVGWKEDGSSVVGGLGRISVTMYGQGRLQIGSEQNGLTDLHIRKPQGPIEAYTTFTN